MSIQRSILIFLLLVAITTLQAQPGGGGPPGGGGEPVPLSGIELLLAGGALLGFRKFLKERKK